MAKKIYYYDKRANAAVTELTSLVVPVAEPTLTTIQGWLQHPMGELAPSSILTVDSAGKLDILKVDVIEFATLDGGDF
jgi:hypothetical protein